MIRKAILLLLAGTTLALAHAGVDGPTKMRMELMKAIAQETKALGKIAKSGGFDRETVRNFLKVLIRVARASK